MTNRAQLSLLAVLLCLPTGILAAQCSATSGERRIALLELYTSEGCNSCPPADRWVSGLPARGLGPDRLVVLGFHVDYWNYLGWTDPYAHRRHTERQQAASARNRARVVYTPQLLLDGKDYRHGLRDDISERVSTINRRAPGAAIRLRLADSPDRALTVNSEIKLLAGANRPVHAWLVLYENGLANQVTAGENRGRHLQHDFVVRDIAGPFAIDASNATDVRHSFQVRQAWKKKDLVAVGFVQDAMSGEVLQALPLPYCGG